VYLESSPWQWPPADDQSATQQAKLLFVEKMLLTVSSFQALTIGWLE